MKASVIDHIGIAVKSIEDSLPFYRKALGLEPVHREEVASQHVRVAFLGSGETSIELLEPTGSEGAVARFMEKRGPGLHHVAFKTEDVQGEMDRLRGDGIAPLEMKARGGARGHRVCFLHPKQTGGVLVELVGGGA